jgi:hypothetical protein
MQSSTGCSLVVANAPTEFNTRQTKSERLFLPLLNLADVNRLTRESRVLTWANLNVFYRLLSRKYDRPQNIAQSLKNSIFLPLQNAPGGDSAYDMLKKVN